MRRSRRSRIRRSGWALALVVAAVMVALLAPGTARAVPGSPVSPYGGLSTAQRASLMAIARDT
jgi:hypothetical protein